MRVEELMSEASCCRPDDTVRDAARLMRDEGIGFVPICDREDRPLGAVTDRDLAVRILAEGRSHDEPLEACMTRDIVSCQIDASVDDVEQLMRAHRVSRVMVCDAAGKLQGVVSLADVAEAESEDSAGRTLSAVKSDEEQPAQH